MTESADDIKDEIAENWLEPPVANEFDYDGPACPFYMCWHEATEWIEIPRTENLVTQTPIRFRACLYHKTSIGEHLQNLAEFVQSGEVPSREPNWQKGALNSEKIDNLKENS